MVAGQNINALGIFPVMLFFFVCSLAFLWGLYFFIRGFFWFHKKRLIENTPTSKIRSIAIGRTEISGHVVLHKKNLLRSPISQHDCVYYKYKIMQTTGKNSRGGILLKDEKFVPFYLQDNTGKIIIDLTDASIEHKQCPDTDLKEVSPLDVPLTTRQFLEKHNIHLSTRSNAEIRNIEEFRICPGDLLYVLGTAKENPTVKASPVSTENIIIGRDTQNCFFVSYSQEKHYLQEINHRIKRNICGGIFLLVGSLVYFMAISWVLLFRT